MVFCVVYTSTFCNLISSDCNAEYLGEDTNCAMRESFLKVVLMSGYRAGLSFRIFEKNSSLQKLKEDQNSSDFFEKLKHIFQKLNISEKFWYSYEATVTPQRWILPKIQEISTNSRKFRNKLKDFCRKLNFPEKYFAWVARISAKRQACLAFCFWQRFVWH